MGNIVKKEAIIILMYADWLVTTINNSIPCETWTRPNPHPCILKITDIIDRSMSEHLVNTVERHTKCSTAYCLRQKSMQQQVTCRFGYPRECQLESTINFEILNNGDMRATLTTKRNDPRINSHNQSMLHHWRANVDVQVIVDVIACAHYMAKYVSKSEPNSKGMETIFASCIGDLSTESNTTSTTCIRKAMIRAVGERDFSAQETAHLLLSLPLYSCTFNFVAISLDETCQIQTSQEHATIVPSLLDVCKNRMTYVSQFPSIRSMHLLQFTSSYCIYQQSSIK